MSGRVLYWGSGSGPAWRAQIALAEKGLKYDSRQIEFSKSKHTHNCFAPMLSLLSTRQANPVTDQHVPAEGHKAPEVLALNPRGQVPTFKDGDVVVNESLAVIQYLDHKYPEPSLQRLIETENLQAALRGVLGAQVSPAQESLEFDINRLCHPGKSQTWQYTACPMLTCDQHRCWWYMAALVALNIVVPR